MKKWFEVTMTRKKMKKLLINTGFKLKDKKRIGIILKIKEVGSMSNGDCQPEEREKPKVKINITQHLQIEWVCPSCHKMNQKTVYTSITNIPLECNYCGKIYIGE